MSTENKIEFLKRLKSLGFKLGAVIAVALINFLAANLNLFNLPGEVQVFLGLVLSEITKYISNLKLGKIGK